MKKKAAFVDHSFHKKTLSTVFLIKLLSETFELTEYYDDGWHGGASISIDALIDGKYDYIFFFQFIPDQKKLKQFINTKIVWFPMWDFSAGMIRSKLLKYQTIPVKIVCFSKTLYDKFFKVGVDCEYFQYFVDPQYLHPVKNYDSLRVYFWNRTELINWNIVKKLLGNNRVDSLTFMAVPDPDQHPEKPPEEDMKNYNILLYDKFLERKDYIDIVSSANIYIAPRDSEGIGISFLEALGRGQYVIAPNSPTMNEYIVHGENGYLYDIKNPEEVDVVNLKLIGNKARLTAIDGFKKWQQQKSRLIAYVGNSNNTNKKSGLALLAMIFYFEVQEFAIMTIKKIFKLS